MFILIFCTLYFVLSQKSADILLSILKCLVRAILKTVKDNKTVEYIARHIPDNSRTVRSRFRLDRLSTVYTVCPSYYTFYQLVDNKILTKTVSLVFYIEKLTKRHFYSKQLIDLSTKKLYKTFTYYSIFNYIVRLALQLLTKAYFNRVCNNCLYIL